MTYKPKTFDWPSVIGAITDTAHDISGLPIVPEKNAEDQPSYPFIVFHITNPYTTMYKSRTKTKDLFLTTVSFSIYAENEGEALAISDDLRTLFLDAKYHEQLRAKNVTVQEVTDSALRNEELTSFMPISIAGFDLVVQLLRQYESDFPTISEFNSKGDVLNGDN